MSSIRRRWLTTCMIGWAGVWAMAGGGPQNVLVVVNNASLDSLEIGRHYAVTRGIPDRHICHVTIPPDSVNLAVTNFLTSVVARVHAHIANHGLSNQIDYIVFVQDLPSRVNDTEGATAVMFYGFKYAPSFWQAGCNLPTNTRSFYFQAERAFRHADVYGSTNYYLSTFLLADHLARARTNILRSVQSDGSTPTGTYYLNKSADPYRNIRYLRFDAFDFAARFIPNFPTFIYGSAYPHSNVLALCDGASGYTSNFWTHTEFARGSLADHLTSVGGRIYDTTHGQSTVLDWMKKGVAGSYGTVSEPCNYLEKFPDPLYLYWYARGFNLAESYWMSVANPHMGLFVGDPLTAPFAQPPAVSIVSPANHETVSGVVTMEVTAASSRKVQRVDLFVDGLYAGTLTNLQPQAGNIITVQVADATYTYIVGPTDTLYSAVAGIASSINSTQRWVRAEAWGDRLLLMYTNYGHAAGSMSLAAQCAIGTGTELRIWADLPATNFLESTYFAREGIRIRTLTSGGANTGDTITCVITLTNGIVASNRIVASQGQSASSLMSALMNAINSDPLLTSTDGVVAVDLVPYSTLATCWLQARSPGPAGWRLHVAFSLTQAIPGQGVNTNDTFKDYFNDNQDVMTARGTIFFSCGRETVNVQQAWSATDLPNGPHEIRVVAYDGTAVEAQGHAITRIVVSNSPFACEIIAPTNGYEVLLGSNVWVDILFTNAPGLVTQTVLYAEGKPAAHWLGAPASTQINTRFFGVGPLTLQARVWSGTESAVSPTVTVSVVMSPTIDTDGDGLPDYWEQQHYATYQFGSAHDMDMDDMSNYEEYVADTDPTNAVSKFFIASISRTPTNTIEIMFPSSTARVYSVLYNDSFTAGDFDAWQTASPVPFPAVSTNTTWVDDGSETPSHPLLATGRVYRVRVLLP